MPTDKSAEATDAQLADAIRFLALDAIAKAEEGHPGAPLGSAETATALFTRHLKCQPGDPEWPDRDRVILSNGHGSMLLYALLYLAGYPGMEIEQIRNFRVLGSNTHGHPEYAPSHGVEITTGLLGQGIANAVGMAVAEAWLNARYGSDLVDHRTWAFVGDGCLMEGVGHEVISLAGHLQLGKLTFLWDDNEITDDGATALSISEDVPARFRAANWHVVHADGHDVESLSCAIEAAKADPRPSLIACRTRIGEGFARLQGQRGAHGGRVFPEDCDKARAERNWPHAPFQIPNAILSAWREQTGGRNAEAHRDWTKRLNALPKADREGFLAALKGELPEGWRDALLSYKSEAAKAVAPKSGILASSEIVEKISAVIPNMISGAPDLEGPIRFKGPLDAFTASNRQGRYVHYGVREHAMGSMMNGMAAHGGVVPIGATYLVFSDYMRPPLRMSAMMGLPVITAYSHDSIGIGTNGPTHQPIEFLASLRAMPNMLVLRPADAVEAAECWEIALARRDGPISLIFARQAIPTLRTDGDSANRCKTGAYVLAEASKGTARVTLIATGSEVQIAVAARKLLEQQGVATRVVSMPSFELFAALPADKRRAIIDPATLRVGIEAAIRQGWERWIGEDGLFIGMEGYGASGPGDQLYRHFGITAEKTVEVVLAELQ
jgi:transketolase